MQEEDAAFELQGVCELLRALGILVHDLWWVEVERHGSLYPMDG